MKIILTTVLAFLFTACIPIQEKTPEESVENKIVAPEEVTEEPTEEIEAPDSEMPPQVKQDKKDAKVTITKFFDFACGYCRRGAQTMQSLQEKFGDDLNVEFRHFVVHPSVLLAHKASECAREQGKFEAFFYEYFDNHFAQTTEGAFNKVGEKIGLNQEKFESCIASNKSFPIIDGHRSMGELIGITGTPSFIINNEEKVSGAVPEEQFEKLVQKYLNEPLSQK